MKKRYHTPDRVGWLEASSAKMSAAYPSGNLQGADRLKERRKEKPYRFSAIPKKGSCLVLPGKANLPTFAR
ncbi:hypothetical protein [Paraflavisolibacter sp. H34]|uniref:hypothetical protein n=1 Tax=Huijunlia imazamoxiresistens TaxID=3127457 RepID=UPI00301ADF2C